MSSVTVLLVVLLLLTIALCALLAFRVLLLRKASTAVLLREIPAGADVGWRHGAVHYSDEALRYFRLSSFKPGPTLTLSRQGLEIIGRREPEGSETDILEGMMVLHLRVTGEHPRCFEVAMGMGAVTAFQSWLEARQSARSQRRKIA